MYHLNVTTEEKWNFPGLCELKNLQELDLSWNEYEGIFPSCVANMTSLRLVELSHNTFIRSIASSPLTKLTSLEYISISSNNFQVPISFKAFFNHSNFNFLFLENNEIINDELGNLVPNFQLEVFSMLNSRGCPSLPSFLYYQSNLRILHLSNNSIGWNFPTWLLENNTRLKRLYLMDNAFTGPLKLPTSINPNMENFDLEGPISEEICNLDNLSLLDLSENKLCGSIPYCFNPSRIHHVYLSNNQLEGELTYAFYNSSSLVSLDLRYNKFIGNIPQSIGNLSHLSIILLSNNHFEGTIPPQFCEMDQLSMIDLSFNFLSRQIPHCFGNLTLEVTEEKSGWVEEVFTSSLQTLLSYMDEVELEMARHVFSLETGFFRLNDVPITAKFITKRSSYTYKGSILNYMSGIDLSSNKLHGKIPDGLGNLSGRIPTDLIKLNVLAIFRVAHNNLAGMIPEKAQFGTFDEGRYQGNPYLCGRPLPNDCTSTGSTPVLPTADDENEECSLMDMEFFYISFIISYLSVVFCIATVLFINSHWRRACFHLIEGSFLDSSSPDANFLQSIE
ncbi:brassinosteroid LRR receptor kinase BRI1-like [Olea europaea var. sylvestris]|uniref:brassinosteroid LRR receptor kinase BRI1-like n=1 Tax=Olea europaea var. sylvestris TaxID=158386 RepID=UPI000C1D3B1B|nr:brassinosteroid LRR receptor kinase BRI1-like [Olea europaea var. sylvestris]